jgi:hypothetical protein
MSLGRWLSPRTTAALLCGLVVFVALALQVPSQGLTDDDDFYIPAGTAYAGWLAQLGTHPTDALSKAGIDAAFAVNREHPPLAKGVFGVSEAVFHRGLQTHGRVAGARLGTVFFAVLLAVTLVLWLWRPLGPTASVGAVALLFSLPRFAFHSQVATLDVPVAAMVVLFTAVFSTALARAQTGRHAGRWALCCGVVFGLACLTKLNAPFALLPALLVVVLSRWRGFSRVDVAFEQRLALPPIPGVVWACLLLGPLVFVTLWPWLWPDPVGRLGGYLAFHLRHYPIYLLYEGVIWEKPFAPWHAPVLHALLVLPVLVLCCGLLGAIAAASSLVRLVRGATATGPHPGAHPKDPVLAMVLLQALFAVGVVATADVPKYGGEKLVMPFFPFLAVLAACGTTRVAGALHALLPRRVPRAAVGVVVVVAAALPGVWTQLRTPAGLALSTWGEVVGGLRGATARGFERTYYDVLDPGLAEVLGTLPAGIAVHFVPNHKEYVKTTRLWQQDGRLPRLQLVSDLARADVVVFTHERRWRTLPALWASVRDWHVVAEQRLDGVPLWTVFSRQPLSPQRQAQATAAPGRAQTPPPAAPPAASR